MKRLIRLALVGALGVIGIFFLGRSALLARLHDLGVADDSTLGSIVSSADSYEPVLLTEWLGSDVFRVSLAPLWMPTEGATAETMRAYAELHDARQDEQALTEEQKRADQHQKNKDLLIERLVAGEISLLEAVNGWIEQDRTYGRARLDIINQVYPGNSQAEKYCQRILRELELSAGHQPDHYQNALIRAQAEFRALKLQGSYLSSN